MSFDAASRAFLERMPKVELHVHLEGSIQPATLLRLAKRRGANLPADTEEGLRDWFEFRDFEHFVDIYVACSACLRDPEDFQLILAEFLQEQDRQNVKYSEVHFTISTHLANGVNGQEVAHAMWETLEEKERELGVRARLIPDIVRNVDPSRADWTLEWAVSNRDRGVVALGISGIESWPDEPFREHFRLASQEGLAAVAHAGEHAGAASIRSALEVTGAQRIGHGIHAVEDPDLLQKLAESGIPLEVCPTSNVCLGAVGGVAEHPFDRLRRAGLEVTVNSDDPPFFNTTLTDEYQLLMEAFSYGPGDAAGFSLAALEHSFLPQKDKTARRKEFLAAFDRLGNEILGKSVTPGPNPNGPTLKEPMCDGAHSRLE